MVIESAIKVKNEVWESVAYYAQESLLYAFSAIMISLLLRIIDFSKEILNLERMQKLQYLQATLNMD